MTQAIQKGRTAIRAEMVECVDHLVWLTFVHGGNSEQTMLDLFQYAKQRYDNANRELRELSRAIQSRMEEY